MYIYIYMCISIYICMYMYIVSIYIYVYIICSYMMYYNIVYIYTYTYIRKMVAEVNIHVASFCPSCSAAKTPDEEQKLWEIMKKCRISPCDHGGVNHNESYSTI